MIFLSRFFSQAPKPKLWMRLKSLHHHPRRNWKRWVVAELELSSWRMIELTPLQGTDVGDGKYLRALLA
jgi:hypothetical protein